MNINVKVLNSCSDLTDYEKDLILRIDVKGESQASVAKFYGKSPATISIQHKKALEKLTGWLKRNKEQEEKPPIEDLDRQVFKMRNKGVPPNRIIEKLGNAERVTKLCKQHRMLMEDDYQCSLKKITEYGLEPNEDSNYPLSEKLDYLIGEHSVLSEEKSEIWTLLEEQSFTEGLDYEAYGSVCDALKRLLGRWIQAEEVLISKRKELEETRNKLPKAENELEKAEQKILKLKRLEKYEHLSEEERKSLELQISLTKKLIRGLQQKVVELKTYKTRLEGEVNRLEQAKAHATRDVQSVVLEFLGSLQLSDVLKLYNRALMLRMQKTIAAH